MSASYLHNHKSFPDLLRLLEQETGILPYLLEKDYWIMHVLYGLKKMGLAFELKGCINLPSSKKENPEAGNLRIF